jgi:uroporphyrinogen decarboxylase
MSLTGAERVLTVLDRREPDRVPTFEWDIDPDFIAETTRGGGYHDFIERFDHDAVVCGADYRKTPLADGTFRDEWGVTRRPGFEAYAMPVDALAPVKSWPDLESWQPPEALCDERFRSLAEFVARYKGRRAVIFRVRDVWSGPRELMGYEELMVQCLEAPELVDRLVTLCVDHSIALMERAAAMGADLVMSGDDIADNHGPLISPALWESLFLPHFRRFERALHACGLRHWKHSDGNIRPLLGSLVDAGIDGIDPVDPLGGMDLGETKREWGGRVAVKGNIDCVELLVRGTPEGVERAVRDAIRAAGPGGGYVCSTSNSIHKGVRPDLYAAMVEAIRTHGRYPL